MMLHVTSFLFLVVLCAADDQPFFRETFDDVLDVFRSKWTKSQDPKYANQPIMVKSADKPARGFDRDKGLSLTQEMKYYGVSSKFPTPLENADGSDIVIQYELKLEETLICGGAYIKLPRLVDETQEGMSNDLRYMNSDTPYSIMFGPDRCGENNDRVHFIIQHQNPVTLEWEEKHHKYPPKIKSDDTDTHLYTLAVYGSSNTFEIFIDKESVSKGSFFNDMDPPIQPQEYISNPNAHKPHDWVDDAYIPDPTAVKPSDWPDDTIEKYITDSTDTMPSGWLPEEPDEIPDPEADRPDEWCDEDDGEWEAPTIPNPICTDIADGCGAWKPRKILNPAYKGPWQAPLVDNPKYVGEWVPGKIRNPSYFIDNHPARIAPMSGIALELWTTNAGVHFDNFLITKSLDSAWLFTKNNFDIKIQIEQYEAIIKRKNDEKERIASLKATGQAWYIIQALLLEFYYGMQEHWQIVLGTTIIIISVAIYTFWQFMPAEGEYGDDVSDNDDQDRIYDDETAEEESNLDVSQECKEDLSDDEDNLHKDILHALDELDEDSSGEKDVNGNEEKRYAPKKRVNGAITDSIPEDVGADESTDENSHNARLPHTSPNLSTIDSNTTVSTDINTTVDVTELTEEDKRVESILKQRIMEMMKAENPDFSGNLM
jgi:hypothetical protein